MLNQGKSEADRRGIARLVDRLIRSPTPSERTCVKAGLIDCFFVGWFVCLLLRQLSSNL
jgi:hypothetical protein